jgi:hypothetical protein
MKGRMSEQPANLQFEAGGIGYDRELELTIRISHRTWCRSLQSERALLLNERLSKWEVFASVVQV